MECSRAARPRSGAVGPQPVRLSLTPPQRQPTHVAGWTRYEYAVVAQRQLTPESRREKYREMGQARCFRATAYRRYKCVPPKSWCGSSAAVRPLVAGEPHDESGRGKYGGGALKAEQSAGNAAGAHRSFGQRNLWRIHQRASPQPHAPLAARTQRWPRRGRRARSLQSRPSQVGSTSAPCACVVPRHRGRVDSCGMGKRRWRTTTRRSGAGAEPMSCRGAGAPSRRTPRPPAAAGRCADP